MLSQTLEYALRAAVCLAIDPDQPMTTQRVAEMTKVPLGYLSKVLQSLGRAGLVKSQRGLHGGFTLIDDPAELTILDIVNAVDPLRRIRECPLGIPAHGPNLCPLHRTLDNVMLGIEQAFAKATIADLIHRPDQNMPLCDMTVSVETAKKTTHKSIRRSR